MVANFKYFLVAPAQNKYIRTMYSVYSYSDVRMKFFNSIDLFESVKKSRFPTRLCKANVDQEFTIKVEICFEFKIISTGLTVVFINNQVQNR